ncbi:hypothetical protein LX73_0977 [Fodinibius salinus]|uniref:Uncharacterized protein n=1 Tax=Fodinibius salinus TaxID=860790 RepID=A0A5D3YPM4_9BACT|nr:hypothetical protein [Fodinibius salinus]TYP95662.1 hypothetical protein LX73_0977 [Fodinibius salinus]
MGRAMLIIVTGLLISLGYTFLGMSDQRSLLNSQSTNSATKSMAENVASTGIQFALHKFSEDSTWPGEETLTFNLENGTAEVDAVKSSNNDTLRITSTGKVDGASTDHTIVTTFDISKNQSLIPDYEGAVSSVGGDISFPNGNHKIHFNGNDASGQCKDKPGLTVHDPDMIDDYDQGDLENIQGDPKISHDKNIKNSDIMDLIELLAPEATTVSNKKDLANSDTDNPGIYTIENRVNLSNTTGAGILIVRNNAEIQIDGDLKTAGQFDFKGLVIFENETEFKATGNANIEGTILSASDIGSNLQFSGNGNFNAQYNCDAKKYADQIVDEKLDTRMFTRLSTYQ